MACKTYSLMIFSCLRSANRSLNFKLRRSSLRYLKSILLRFYLSLFSQMNKNRFAIYTIFPLNCCRSSTTRASSALISISFSSFFLNRFVWSPFRIWVIILFVNLEINLNLNYDCNPCWKIRSIHVNERLRWISG